MWLNDRWGAEKPGATLAERRAAEANSALSMRTLTRAPRAGKVLSSNHVVSVQGGEITVRLYRPDTGNALPVHVFIHGGSFWKGSIDEYDPLCRWYASSVGCAVASVEYRLPPEHPYPTPPEDCYAALCWVVEHATALGLDASRVSIGGVSAGGALAAAVTLMARDRGGPSIIFQLLEIPVTDTTLSQPSIEAFGTGYLLTRAELAEGYGFYLSDPAQAREPYASPLLSEDLSGLPPAFIMTAEYDPLRDEGEAYARRLQESGVPVRLRRYEGHLHGSIYITRLMPSAREAIADAVAALRTAHGIPAEQRVHDAQHPSR
jgi:acetyl esterase